jgi:hypothetical protein
MGGWGAYEKGWAEAEARYEWAAARFTESGASPTFEYLVMKHVQTADGAWADLVVGEGGQPLRFFLEPAENAAQPGAEAKGFGLIAGLGNLVLLGDDFRHSGRSHLPL